MVRDRVSDTSSAEEQRSARGSSDSERAGDHVEQTFARTEEEGRRRLSRPLWPLLSTGLVGGIDVGTGVLALLLVQHNTGSVLLSGLAFSIGLIALTLAGSELFTEGFLVPVGAVIARQAQWRMLVRLWGGTLVANLVGGWVFTYFVMRGFPDMARTAVEAGVHYIDLGLGLQSFSLAILGGAVMTLMTWMQHSSESVGLRVVPAIGAAFLLAGGHLNHVIVSSLLMFAALHTDSAPFGYAAWAATAGWAAVGNLLGGVGLVTLLRVVQVHRTVQFERANPARGVARDDARQPDG